MQWKIEYLQSVLRKVNKMNPQSRMRIKIFLEKKLLSHPHPRDIGKSLKNTEKPIWRYRVGDYRILCELHDNEQIVLVVDIDHRSRIYQRLS